ncbi:Heat shock protein [Drechslerella dactyloides]|uniref:Heat shock protein n=1 Tax=Drechslerella dactyloides TaxID=74499 RepID=A0AAD6NLW3_DREDA|nr:Heat shock protein [Drechslerella dactyloides]
MKVATMERETLIVAVDFGTTYSGVAYCHASQNGLHDAEVVVTWPSNGIAPKVPTEIRYYEARDPSWGAEASLAFERRQNKSPAAIYGRFKLLLDPTVGNSVYDQEYTTDDPESIDVSTLQLSDGISLPPKKSAVDVTTDFLRLLYSELMQRHLRKRLPDTLDLTPIHFVFTIPAIWGHKAQEATRGAAQAAGFCSRPSDTLSLVSEPEAAAMFVLHAMCDKDFSRISSQTMSQLKKGDNFVICDAGGGTVDLISYEVAATEPGLKLQESAVGTGAKCGASYIDQAFLQLLKSRIGKDFDNPAIWTEKHIGRGSTLMKTFDSIKRSFGQTTNNLWFLELPVKIEDNEALGIMDNELEFTAQDLKNLFDPVVAKVIQLVANQVHSIRSTRGIDAISTVFLVGGFGESFYLYERMVEWATAQDPPLIVVNPSKSWSAIMRGAIIQTLEPAIKSRRLRQHYGFQCDPLFNPAKHSKFKDHTQQCPFGGVFLKNSIKWAAELGDEYENEDEIEFSIFTVLSKTQLLHPYIVKLWGSRKRKPPIFEWSYGVYEIGNVAADFSSIDIEDLESKWVGEGIHAVQKYKIDFVVKMKIGSADATFSVWLGNKCVGITRLSYDDEGKTVLKGVRAGGKQC